MLSTFKSRLILMTTLSALAGGLVGYSGYQGINNLAQTQAQIMLTSTALRNHLQSDMMHDALRGDVLTALQAKDAAGVAEASAAMKEHATDFRERLAANDALPLSPEIRAGIADVRPSLDTYIKSAESMIVAAETDHATADEKLPEFQRHFEDLEERMGKLSELIETSAQSAADVGNQHAASAPGHMLISGLVGAGVVGVLGWFVTSALSRRLNAVASNLADIAQGEGDLSRRLDANDKSELGVIAREFNLFVSKINQIMLDLDRSVGRVQQGAEQIAAATEETARSMEEQNANVGEISQAVEEMAAASEEVNQRAGHASGTAGEAGKFADQGKVVMGNTIDRIRSLEQVVLAGAQRVQNLGSKSEQIGQIIGVINDIADQTNLLALNAAIEAARAGEHGKGFAVVADEVRKLAERTTTATKQVADSIRQIQDETKSAVTTMENGTSEVKQGVELAESASEGLARIVHSVQNTSGAISEIVDLVKSHGQLCDKVHNRVGVIRSAADQVQTATTSTGQAAFDLTGQAEALSQIVARFKLDRATSKP